MSDVQRLSVVPGAFIAPGYLDATAQRRLMDQVLDALGQAPLYRARMPRSGRPLSVMMSNCGALGWYSDEAGYRYVEQHPATGAHWPPIPALALAAWRDLVGQGPEPDACLVNWYGPEARMGLHQDRDEEDLQSPVLSLSLGDTALFRMGSASRRGPTKSLALRSGDALWFGGPARLAYHGIDRIMPGTSSLVPHGGRINLTLRRVRQS